MRHPSVTCVTVPRDYLSEATPDQLRAMACRALEVPTLSSDQSFTALAFLELVHAAQRQRDGA